MIPVALQIIGSILLAIVPVFLWGSFYYKKNPEDKKLLLLTFAAGGLAVFPILLYKMLWDYFPWINAFKIADRYDHLVFNVSTLAIPLSVILTFMIVGVIEEIMKMLSVKVVDDEKFDSIDDSMEFFIMAALGFAFVENILYFFTIWSVEGASDLLMPFIFRSSFSTFAHILFSGVLGYFYGIAHFAKPILQERIKENRYHWTNIFHKIFKLKKERLFYQEKMIEGLFIAILLHSMFNIFLELNITYMLIPFLLFGYKLLNFLFARKDSHKDYKMLYQGRRNHANTKSKIYFALNPIKND